MSNIRPTITRMSTILYLALFLLGIHAAYNDKLAAALFFAITWASENISISIDYWPGMQRRRSHGEDD